MTGNQPDPSRAGREEMACRCMPAGCETDVRPAMLRITAIAACRPRRVAIVHFSSPFQSDGCSGNRTKPVPRRSGDDAPCSPERGCHAALRRRIPADCVPAGTDRVRCRTGRTVHRRLSHAHYRKERASFTRARPDKGLARQRGGRNGCGRREVTKLKHAARGTHRARGGPALPDKAEQCSAAFLPMAGRPFTPICRANLRGCRREMFHALYMPRTRSRARISPTSRGVFVARDAGRRHALSRHRDGRPRRDDAACARHRDAWPRPRMERRRRRGDLLRTRRRTGPSVTPRAAQPTR
jgi:hypothetical protein